MLARNLGRGFADVALFEMGLVFLGRPDAPGTAPILPVSHAPSAAELARLQAALPDQPLHLAVTITGRAEAAGWWGDGRPACFEDAVEAAREVLRVSRVPFRVRADQYEPWHPGRCAAIYLPGGGRQSGWPGTPANCIRG